MVVSAEALFALTDLCGLNPDDAIASAARTAATLTEAAFGTAPCDLAIQAKRGACFGVQQAVRSHFYAIARFAVLDHPGEPMAGVV